MGIAPTAGRCVAASIMSMPAGVMGRPCAAGSCWLRAFIAMDKEISRKMTGATDFVFILFAFPNKDFPTFFPLTASQTYWQNVFMMMNDLALQMPAEPACGIYTIFAFLSRCVASAGVSFASFRLTEISMKRLDCYCDESSYPLSQRVEQFECLMEPSGI